MAISALYGKDLKGIRPFLFFGGIEIQAWPLSYA